MALDKASAVLAQAQKLFDLERIQLAAAQMGKVTEEEKARLKVKQDILDLEDAINEGNVTAAAKISQTLVTDAQYLGQIAGFLTGIQGVKNPFADWLASLEQMLLALTKITSPTIPISTSSGQKALDNAYSWNNHYSSNPNDYAPTATMDNATSWAGHYSTDPSYYGGTTVNVSVQGSVTTQQDLVNSITNAIYNNQASGIPINYSTAY